MTGFDVKRKRPWWFSWIPAAILVAIMAGVAITVLVVQASDLGKPLPKPTVGQVNELNWSSFSQDGIDYIDRSRNIRIDFSRPPVTAAGVDLPDDGTTTIGPTQYDDRDNDYYLIVSGGGEGYGGTKITVSELTLTTEGGLITELRASTSGALPFRNALALLQGQVDEFGWPAPDTAQLFQRVEEATRAGTSYDFTFGPGDRLGFTISATATCETSGFCVVRYDVLPRVG